MRKQLFIAFLAVIITFFAGSRGEAFVPQTSHLLYLVVKKIRVPGGMTVFQTRYIAASDTADTNGVRDGENPSGMEAALPETLSYLFPEKLRSEIHQELKDQFYVLSGQGFVKVENGQVTDMDRSPTEFYTDPLLYRNFETLLQTLALRGINVDKVTLQRLDDGICWFIGDPVYGKTAGSGLWIGKDDFLFKRYVIKTAGWTIDARYKDWRQVGTSWYPGTVQIFVDDTLFATIVADRMEPAVKLSAPAFDVAAIMDRYHVRAVQDTPAGTETLDSAVETFKKLYD